MNSKRNETTSSAPVKSRLRRWLLLAVGGLSLAAGIVGIFVPLWPTTCFLLVSAACFSKSSDRVYRWMTTNRIFGRHLVRYREEGIVDVKVCRASLFVLWPSLALSLALTQPPLWVWLAVSAVGLAVTIHLRSLVQKTTAQQRSEGNGCPIHRSGAATPSRSYSQARA